MSEGVTRLASGLRGPAPHLPSSHVGASAHRPVARAVMTSPAGEEES